MPKPQSSIASVQIDLTERRYTPAAGWAGMPECVVADRLRRAGAVDRDVRLFLTLTAAMDRARDADRLWFAGMELFRAAPWCFDPHAVLERTVTELRTSCAAFR